jgi:hypothetical protein
MEGADDNDALDFARYIQRVRKKDRFSIDLDTITKIVSLAIQLLTLLKLFHQI